MPASPQSTTYLHLTIYPDITGVYQRDIRLALISAVDNNMVKIDAGVKAVADALDALINSLADVATSGSYNDLSDQPTIPAETPIATTLVAGKVIPDGVTILVDENGVITGAAQVDIATTEAAGIVMPDGTTITVDEDGTIHAINGYTKDEVDEMLEEMSELLLSDTDRADLYSLTNSLLGTNISFTGLGASIIDIYNKVETLIS